MTTEQMTRAEARKIATAMNRWRRDDTGRLPMPSSRREFGLALDVLSQPCTIAQNIRHAAINWPHFLGNVESQIIYAFMTTTDEAQYLRGTPSIDWRWFLLFIAEELES